MNRYKDRAPSVVRRRPTKEETLASLAIKPGGVVSEHEARRINEFLRAGLDGGNYRPVARQIRLVGDGIEPIVFSDGRGNGAWELYCWYCGVKGAGMIQEHMLPRALHGSDDASNIVSACRDCNAMKGGRCVEGLRGMLERAGESKPFVFAGEANLCVTGADRFVYFFSLSPESRREVFAASLARKNPDPPAPSIDDLFKNNPAKGLL